MPKERSEAHITFDADGCPIGSFKVLTSGDWIAVTLTTLLSMEDVCYKEGYAPLAVPTTLIIAEFCKAVGITRPPAQITTLEEEMRNGQDN